MFSAALPHAQNQRRAGARADQPVWLVFAKHRNRVSPLQLPYGGLDRFKHIAVVQTVHQVSDDLGVGLTLKHIAARLQAGTQFIMVFDDAVVHQRHPAGAAGGVWPRPVAEVRVGVVHHRGAVGGPARVGDAGSTLQMALRHLRQQLGHALGAASPLQAAGVHRHATGVITPVLQPLQALHQNRNDIAGRDRSNNATHTPSSLKSGPMVAIQKRNNPSKFSVIC